MGGNGHSVFRQFKNPGPVPIVGQTHEVFECVPVATARCRCRTDNKPFTIAGINTAQVCTHCGNVYAITRVLFERGKMPGVLVTVTLVGNQAQQAEPQVAESAAAPDTPKE